jgi:Peptidase M15
VTPLTPHFSLEEFQKDAPIPSACIGIFGELAEKILEPVRSEFQKGLVITSGYRSTKENAAAHGIPNSEHIATTFFCACDFYVEGLGSRFVFDWIRQNPTLPFHQLILESDASGGSIIHVSYNKTIPGVRSVLIGATHNAAPYQKVDYVVYEASESQDEKA